MANEKSDLRELRERLYDVQEQLSKMQHNETSFTIEDRLHEELNDQRLSVYFGQVFEPVYSEIRHRESEIN